MLPTVMTASGLTPRLLTDIRADYVQRITTANPGFTADLPGELIEDFVSSASLSISMMEQARVDTIASISPYASNEFLTNLQGAQAGLDRGEPNRTTVYVLFTSQTLGYLIPRGFTVSDGAHQYTVLSGGVIGSDGTANIQCTATSDGSWSVPANTVNQFVSSVPDGITLTCNNPVAGTPGTGSEDFESYHARVLQAFKSPSIGGISYLKTLISKVPGVTPRLISVQQGTGGAFKILVGGGDPYAVAAAIFAGFFDIFDLQGSATTARNVTVSLTDYPDVYQIIFINPPAQLVGLQITWNTSTPNFTSDNSIVAATMPVLVNYINSLPIGYSINTAECTLLFMQAVASILDNQYLSHLAFGVTINGTPVPPTAGTNMISGDSEGYFYTSAANVTFTRA